jgi:hypothetical protein
MAIIKAGSVCRAMIDLCAGISGNVVKNAWHRIERKGNGQIMLDQPTGH